MAEGRKLSEMVPRCLWVNTWKTASEGVRHPCGVSTTENGWPRPGDDEVEVGRWNVMGARLFVDLVADPSYGAMIQGGDLGVLVTDKSVRGSFYAGKARGAKLDSGHKLTFYWPFELMAEPGFGTYEGLRVAVGISDPGDDGHLVLEQFTKPKTTKPDDFLSPIFSMKNRSEEFVDQLVDAHRRYIGSRA